MSTNRRSHARNARFYVLILNVVLMLIFSDREHLITYLTEDEITALLAAPDPDTWTGRRDQALLMLACQTGLRATELASLATGDVHLGTGANVSCLGQGELRGEVPAMGWSFAAQLPSEPRGHL
jgi:site-specific recombinase XerD